LGFITMKIGKLRNKITIQKPIETTNDEGEIIQTWEEFATVWAEINPLIGREYWASKQTTSEVTGKIRIRYIAGITPKMRVKFGERIFNIEGLINPDEKNIEIILFVNEVL